MKNYSHFIVIFLQKIGHIIFFITYKIFIGIKIKGKNNLLGLKGPIILAPNHTSELDVTALPLTIPFFSRIHPIYFVMNAKDRYKTLGWRGYIYGSSFLNFLGGSSVYSGYKNYAVALENHIKLLKEGRTICIFPEGKRTLDGNINPARGGLGYLVYATGATVVPIAIDTFFNISVLDFITRKRKVVITVGRPMKASEVISPDIKNPNVEDFRHASQMVLDKVKEMMDGV